MINKSNFIILSTQRTGSTWVIDMLNSHPDIVAYSELLKDDGAGYPMWGGSKDYPFFNEYKKQMPPDADYILIKYLDNLFFRNRYITGFKVMYNQNEAYPEIQKYIIDNNIKVIHLYRENYFDIYLSKLVAKSTGIYHSTTKKVDKRVQIKINTGELIAFFDRLKSDFQRYREQYRESNGFNYMEISYEDLVNKGDGFKIIQKFIDVEPKKLRSELKKVNRYNKKDLIVNYEEVREVLSANNYEKFL